MAHRSSASTARLVGLLILGILFLAGIGLFGLEYSHDEGHAALEESIESSVLLDEARSAQVAFKIQVQDWKNFLLRGRQPADHEKYVAQFAASEAEVDGALDALHSSELLPPALRDEVASIRAEHARLGVAYREAMKKFDPQRIESTFEVDAGVRGIDQKLTQRIDTVAQQILAGERERAAALRQKFERSYAMLRSIVAGATAAVLVLLALVVWRGRAASR